jgi:ribose 5-phosphate isomerase A
MRVGLGTGSTAWHVVDLLGARLRAGDVSDVVGVPTSRATEQQARSLDIPLSTLDDVTSLDLCIDGCDEVDPQLDLIKGLGGALLWEKIVARAAARLIIVADDSKDVGRLGTLSPLPVEVVPFGWRTHLAAMQEAGGRPILRTATDGGPFITDGGHYIVDIHFEDGIADAHSLESALRSRAGIIETGLFLDMADTLVTATANGVTVRERRQP